MPRWMTLWLAWARDRLFRRARPLSAAVGYERAGVTRWESPVPWAADAAVLDVLLRLPPSARRKQDFALRLPFATFPADALRPDGDDRCRLAFRLPVPPEATRADLLWRGRVIADVPIPVLTPGEFLAGLTLAATTVSVQMAGTSAAATSFVPDCCEGVVASAVLRCRTPLAPLGEIGLKAVFTDDLAGRSHAVLVALPAAQLARNEAVVAAACPESPRRAGGWWVSWVAGDRTLATQRLQAIPAARFEAGVRLLETRFALLDPGGGVCTVKLPPSPAGSAAVGPCFVLSSGEAGAAGVCRLEVLGVSGGDPYPLVVREAEAVVTDSPTVFVPALFSPEEVARVSGFELRLRGRLLGVASLRPVPTAAINAEGGFTPPVDFAWTSAADDELADRLRRLQG